MSIFLVEVGGGFHNNSFPTIEDAKKHIENNYNYGEYPELQRSATIYEVTNIIEKKVTSTVTWIENKTRLK